MISARHQRAIKAHELNEDGYSIDFIAEVLDVNNNTVYAYLALDYKLIGGTQRRLFPENADARQRRTKARELHEDGYDNALIAQVLEVTEQTIKKYLD